MAFFLRACVYPSASSSTDHEAQVTCPNLSVTLAISRNGTGQNQLLIPEPVQGSGAKVDKCRLATCCNRAICLFNRRMPVCPQTVCMPPHSQHFEVFAAQCMPVKRYNEFAEMAPATHGYSLQAVETLPVSPRANYSAAQVGYYAPRAPNVVRVQAMPLQQVLSSHLLGSCLRHLRYLATSA